MHVQEDADELVKLTMEMEKWKKGIREGYIGGNGTTNIIEELETKIIILKHRLGIK